MNFDLSVVLGRLKHYQLNGDFNKTFIPSKQGWYIKGIKEYSDNIKIKIKRDLFLMIHENGSAYLVDSLETPKTEVVNAGGGQIKALRVYDWKKLPLNIHLLRLQSFINNPDTLVKLGLSISDPMIVAKIKMGGMTANVVRESDISELRSIGAQVVFAPAEDRELEYKIKCRK